MLISPCSLQEPRTAFHRTGIPIAALDISPDRTHAVLAGREILKTIRVDGAKCSEALNIRSAVKAYTSSRDTTGGLFTSRSRDQLAIRDVKWSSGPCSSIIATAAANGRIVIYDLRRPGLELSRFHEHNRQVHKLSFNPYGPHHLLSGSQDGSIRQWDLRTLWDGPAAISHRSKFQFQGHNEGIRDVRWSPKDVFEFAAATDNGTIQRWDCRNTRAPLLQINAHQKGCFSIDWHQDGRHLATGGGDSYVKVWDFRSTDRRQKPCAWLRAPHAVHRVRWRPGCWSGNDQGEGAYESCQLTTSYDKEDPRIHLWDLRRPHIPFQTLQSYPTPPTEMLWQAEDLIWTVGTQGMFTQTDIHYAPRTVKRRPTCKVYSSPAGEETCILQRRPKRRFPGIDDVSADFLGGNADHGSSGERISASHSFNDEENLLSSSFRRRLGKGVVPKSSNPRSLGNTPPSRDEPTIPVVDFRDTLDKLGSGNRIQTVMTHEILGATANMKIWKFLAENYEMVLPDEPQSSPTAVVRRAAEPFEKNAHLAELVGLYRVAQSWRIVGQVFSSMVLCLAEEEEQRRAEGKRETERQRSSMQDGVDVGAHETRLGYAGKRRSDETAADKASARLSTEPQERLRARTSGEVKANRTRGLPLEPESTSNISTPLARPLPDSPRGLSSELSPPNTKASELEILPLPPPFYTDSNKAKQPAPTTTGSAVSSNQKDRQQDPFSSTIRSNTSSYLQLPGLDRDERTSLQRVPSAQGHLQSLLRPSTSPFAPNNSQRPSRPDLPSSPAANRLKFSFLGNQSSVEQSENNSGQFDPQRRKSLGFPNLFPLQLTASLNKDPSTTPQLDMPPADQQDEGAAPSAPPSPLQHSSSGKRAASPEDEMAGTDDGGDDISETASFDQRRTQQREALRDFRPQHRAPLELGTNISSRPMQMARHDSEESYHQMFSLSDGNSVPNRSALGSLPTSSLPAVDPEDSIEDDQDNITSGDGEKTKSEGNYKKLPKERYKRQEGEGFSTQIRSRQTQEPNKDATSAFDESELLASFTRMEPFLEGRDIMRGAPGHKDIEPINVERFQYALKELLNKTKKSGYNPTSPWSYHSIQTMLAEMHTKSISDSYISQFCAVTASILKSLFIDDPHNSNSDSSSGEQPSSSFNTVQIWLEEYHQRLMEEGLTSTAAAFRAACSPLFPRVSSYLDADNTTKPACATCLKPIAQSPNGPWWHCTRCGNSAAVCPICEQREPPISGGGHNPRREGSANFWATCERCGHGGHPRCISEWLADEDSGGACPVAGCGCDCGPGLERRRRVRDAELKEAASSMGAPARDSWFVGETRAVERVRGVLVGGSSNAGMGRSASVSGPSGGSGSGGASVSGSGSTALGRSSSNAGAEARTVRFADHA